MKTNSNGRRPLMEDNLKILKVEYLSNHLLDQNQILNLSLYDKSIYYKYLNEEDITWKMTSHGRWPQNIKSAMSQQPQFGLYSNFKLNLRWPNHILQIFKITHKNLFLIPLKFRGHPLLGLAHYFKVVFHH